jgi:hypothetical protein
LGRVELEPQQRGGREQVHRADREDRDEQVTDPKERHQDDRHGDPERDDPGLRREPVQGLRDRHDGLVLEPGEPREDARRRVRTERR